MDPFTAPTQPSSEEILRVLMQHLSQCEDRLTNRLFETECQIADQLFDAERRLEETTEQIDEFDHRLTELFNHLHRLATRIGGWFCQLSTRMAVSDRNAIARKLNYKARSPHHRLSPLYAIATNMAIAGFPATRQDITNLTEQQLDSFLGQLGEDSPRGLGQKQLAFMKAVGLKVFG